MPIERPIDQAYPKVKPLTQALVAAAKEQGATADDCTRHIKYSAFGI